MKAVQARYPVNEPDRTDNIDHQFDDAPRRIRIPNRIETPDNDPAEQFGELDLLVAVAILGALAVAMTVSGLFR